MIEPGTYSSTLAQRCEGPFKAERWDDKVAIVKSPGGEKAISVDRIKPFNPADHVEQQNDIRKGEDEVRAQSTGKRNIPSDHDATTIDVATSEPKSTQPEESVVCLRAPMITRYGRESKPPDRYQASGW